MLFTAQRRTEAFGAAVARPPPHALGLPRRLLVGRAPLLARCRNPKKKSVCAGVWIWARECASSLAMFGQSQKLSRTRRLFRARGGDGRRSIRVRNCGCGVEVGGVKSEEIFLVYK